MSTILSIMKEPDTPTLFDIIKENSDITYNEAAKVQKDINLRNEESAAAIKGAGVCITAGMKRDRDATDKMKKTKLIPMTEEEEYRNAGITKGEIGMSSPKMKEANKGLRNYKSDLLNL